jgi:hypothetical protein
MNEINELYEKINKCDNWSEKLELIKNIKELVDNEEEKINNLLLSLDEIKKISKKKINIENIINEFKTTDDIETKILLYQSINSYYNKINSELFS